MHPYISVFQVAEPPRPAPEAFQLDRCFGPQLRRFSFLCLRLCVRLQILAFILIRNIPGYARSVYSSFFAWFGKISLEVRLHPAAKQRVLLKKCKEAISLLEI